MFLKFLPLSFLKGAKMLRLFLSSGIGLVLLVLIVAPVASQTMDSIVSVARHGEVNLKAIDSSGTLVTTYWSSPPEGYWRLVGNIPELASRPATAPFVAISANQRALNPAMHCALTANGDFYWEVPLEDWIFLGNIGEDSEHSPNGNFVALCTGAGLQAVTDMGEHYQFIGSYVTAKWEYVSSIPESVGVVSTETESFGKLKTMFR